MNLRLIAATGVLLAAFLMGWQGATWRRAAQDLATERAAAAQQAEYREYDNDFERERIRADNRFRAVVRTVERVRILPVPAPAGASGADAACPDGLPGPDVADLEQRLERARQESLDLAAEADSNARQLNELIRRQDAGSPKSH